MTRLSSEDEKMEGTITQTPDDLRDISPDLEPVSGSVSDNDTSERSAREKLKKASLASLGIRGEERTAKGTGEQLSTLTSNAVAQRNDATETFAIGEEVRGRPLKKRSHDKFEGIGGAVQIGSDCANGRARKRSRDIDSVGSSKSEGRPPPNFTDRVKEECEDPLTAAQTTTAGAVGDYGTQPGTATAREGGSPGKNEATFSSFGGKADRPGADFNSTTRNFETDRRVDTGTMSPRKKRSRDQLDTDLDREQKIAATEEARALRLSSEIDRGETISGSAGNTPPPGTSHDADRFDVESPKNVLGTSSSNASPAVPRKAASLSKLSDTKTTSHSSFASSGFAALANSTTSPFTNVMVTSTSNEKSFAVATSGTRKEQSKVPLAAHASSDPAIGGFGSSANPMASIFGRSEPPSFGAAGLAKPSLFGGPVFGGGFGAGFGSGNKLSSFAAPTGDTRLTGGSGAIRPIGSLDERNEEDRTSDSDDESEQDGGKDDGAVEVDERFQHQDGKSVPMQEASLLVDRFQLTLEKTVRTRSLHHERVYIRSRIIHGKRMVRASSNSTSQHLRESRDQQQQDASSCALIRPSGYY